MGLKKLTQIIQSAHETKENGCSQAEVAEISAATLGNDPPLSWYASISAMCLNTVTPLGQNSPPTSASYNGNSNPSRIPPPYSFPPSDRSNIRDGAGISSPVPAQRARSIPIHFLVNPTPQSPRSFTTFELPSPSSTLPSISTPSSIPIPHHPSGQLICQYTPALFDDSVKNTLPDAQQSRLYIPPSTSTPEPASSDNNPSCILKVSNSGVKGDTEALSENGTNPTRSVSVRRTKKPDVKITKTGKISHRVSRSGFNKKTTAYNRFLQQQSKCMTKNYPHLTPQERMKLIAEAWAVSEKNPHTTRRSRFQAVVDSRNQGQGLS
ncbi:hypothetical protein BX616_009839 [Lobosporangium transversale]|uniref:Uncharacterized protein n=1 Tax=Lobosporangium transversale TaxID=64571 RepID=A0A1Y2GXR9_9FUNG|nr:hypothetical protein BCR41DRAFT_347402 [Lobosporangium transversale]KAF9913603.1 hypothetical protein BX616_009839 [Lobosporangium transversale]ORZ27089.1 hypothetical protein BCR41DRAFT_347402 [Lobosporangium transversale]|eukprot:XP_021884836.1 hypothetical protein BCR41DRAFT_347402 [Lobosporangium transversale]